LNDPAVLVVADASAVINLNATGYAREIIRALPNPFVVVNAVMAELEEGQRRGRQDAHLLNGLLSDRLVEIVRLNELACEWFEGLVIGRATETLDDGEAATIAYAVEHLALALIDERKANRICAERFPELSIASTVDLLGHPKLEETLGRQALADAVFNALQYARMRVSFHKAGWVVDLIGRERAAICSSLPNSVRFANPKSASGERQRD
jgi:predicted nucleic acid-binding protein